MKLETLTVSEFTKFVGDGIFTVTFRKQDDSVRVMNARLHVKKYVKGTQPETTAKRNATLKAQNMIGVYEMRGTSDRIEAENYRTINLNTILELHANGEKLVREG